MNEIKGIYWFDFDVGKKCELNFINGNRLEGIILQYYKNENNIHLIVQSNDEFFIASYNYKKNRVFYSENFSSYKDAKFGLVDLIKEFI